MTKQELIKTVALQCNMTQELAGDAVDAVMGAIKDAVVKEGRFMFPGFGTFKRVQRAACERPNPQNREKKIKVPAHKTIKFKPAPVFKDVVNG